MNDIIGVYPNPFDNFTTISIKLPDSSHVGIDIINMQGKIVERLAQGKIKTNVHYFTWNSKNNPSGIYFVKLRIGSRVFSRMICLKSF